MSEDINEAKSIETENLMNQVIDLRVKHKES